MTQDEAKEHPVRAFLRRISYRTLYWLRDRAINVLNAAYRTVRVLHRAANRLDDRKLCVFVGDSIQCEGIEIMRLTITPPNAEQLALLRKHCRLDA